MGISPGSISNIVVDDQGNRWDVEFDWSESTTGQSGHFTAQFPRDFKEINPDDTQQEMLELALAVFRGQNIIPD